MRLKRFMLQWRPHILALLIVGALPRVITASDDESVSFFNTKILPVLVRECYECHSATSDDPKGELRLDSRDGLRAGGESGEAIVAGDPDASLLIEALRHESFEMPPKKKLPDDMMRMRTNTSSTACLRRHISANAGHSIGLTHCAGQKHVIGEQHLSLACMVAARLCDSGV